MTFPFRFVSTLYILLFYIINFVYRGIKDVVSPHPRSSCLYKSLEKRVTIDIFGTNRSTTHPCALAKISTVIPLRNYLLSRVEAVLQTKFKGVAYLNDIFIKDRKQG